MALTVTDRANDITDAVNREYMPTFLSRAIPMAHYFLGSKQAKLSKHGSTGTALWRRIAEITPSTTALSEVTTAAYMQGRTPAQLSKSDVTATVQKFGNFVILNEEVVDFEKNPLIDDTMANLGEAAGRSANMLQRNVLEDGLTARYAGNAASAGAVASVVTAGDIKRVLRELVNNTAKTFTPMNAGSDRVGSTPILPAFIGIHHPDMTNDLALIAGYKSVEQYAGHVNTYPNEHGYLSANGKAIRFIQSEDATVDADSGGTKGSADLISTSGTDVDLYSLVVFGRDCHGSVGFGETFTDGSYQPGDKNPSAIDLIVKPFGSGGTSDPYNEIMTVAYKFWHAGAILDARWGRTIIAAATDMTN